MYSEQIITLLAERIGFNTPLEQGFTIELDEANALGSSGRFFSSFHSLVIVENIFAALPDLGEDADEAFNLYLSKLRNQATLEVLPAIMDKNPDYKVDFNYDEIITANKVLFDDAIGYKVAMMCLELFVSTTQSNLHERNAKMSISNLKLELEGFKNDSNILVAKGLVHKYEAAIKRATRKLFPIVPIIQDSSNIW